MEVKNTFVQTGLFHAGSPRFNTATDPDHSIKAAYGIGNVHYEYPNRGRNQQRLRPSKKISPGDGPPSYDDDSIEDNPPSDRKPKIRDNDE